jgi:hypothetical protein
MTGRQNYLSSGDHFGISARQASGGASTWRGRHDGVAAGGGIRKSEIPSHRKPKVTRARRVNPRPRAKRRAEGTGTRSLKPQEGTVFSDTMHFMASPGTALMPSSPPVPDEPVRCPRCRGKGRTGALRSKCLLCSGHRTVFRADAADYIRDLFVPCTECRGTGKFREVKCKMCDGSGMISAETAESLGDCEDEFQAVGKLVRYLAFLGVAVVGTIICVLWKNLVTALWYNFALLFVLEAALFVFGPKCIACGGRIWLWKKSVDARYSDSLHERCCTEPDATSDRNPTSVQ